jgi:hypothetical protein
MAIIKLKECDCGSGLIRYATYDGYGTFLTYVCMKCHEKKMKRYRPDMGERHIRDEPIEPEE